MIVTGGVPQDFKPIVEWLNWFHPKQMEFIDALGDYYEIGYVGGNGSGKTRILYWSAVALLLGVHKHQPAKPPLKIKALVTDFEHGLEEVAHDALHRPCWMPNDSEIGPMMPPSMIKDYPRKEDRSLKLKNGSILFFMTSEQKKRLHSGQNIDILLCDEEADEGAYDESKRGLRNAKGGGRILHALTPPYLEGQGPSWSKFKLLDPYEEGTARRSYIIKACMADNPAVTKKFMEEFRKGKTEEQWRTQFYGDYPSWGTVVHPFEDIMWDGKEKGHLIPRSWQPPADNEIGKFEMGIDWHQSKPTACVWSYTDDDGNVTFFDELSPHETKDKSISELADIIRVKESGFMSSRRVIRWADPKMHDKNKMFDGKGFSAWQEFANCGIRLVEGYNRMPEVGVSIVNDFLRGDKKNHPRMFVRENCTNLRKNLKNHYWQTRGDQKVPDDKFKDYCICVRYVLQNKSIKARHYGKSKVKWGLTSYDHLPGFRATYDFGHAKRGSAAWRLKYDEEWRRR